MTPIEKEIPVGNLNNVVFSKADYLLHDEVCGFINIRLYMDVSLRIYLSVQGR